MDICVLCDFLDDICGSLVFDRHLQEHSTLHGVTLPRSWLVRLTRKLENPGSWDIELHRCYLEPLGELLGQLYTGNHAGNLICEYKLDIEYDADIHIPLQQITCYSRAAVSAGNLDCISETS